VVHFPYSTRIRSKVSDWLQVTMTSQFTGGKRLDGFFFTL
jgi:hypothetical protein